MVTKEYLRPDEVAEILSISRRKVYDIIDDPTNPLPASKIDGQYRIKIEDLKAYMKANRYKPWV
jgi:excisionase family DNA binding protein